jgi:hypothetical protein
MRLPIPLSLIPRCVATSRAPKDGGIALKGDLFGRFGFIENGAEPSFRDQRHLFTRGDGAFHPDSYTALLTLLDVTISRLSAYRTAYQQAMTEDAAPAPAPVRAPLPLPVPWHAW